MDNTLFSGARLLELGLALKSLNSAFAQKKYCALSEMEVETLKFDRRRINRKHGLLRVDFEV
jgi:hypothetical protein